MKHSKFFLVLILALAAVLSTACASTPEISAPGVTLTVDPAGGPSQVNTGIQLLVLMTVLSIAPSILILATSFTRLIIVLSLLRNAIGTPQIPPNQVLIGLSMLLTFFIMTPVYNKVNDQALQPYLKQEITQEQFFTKAISPIRDFMFKQTREKDLELFLSMSGADRPKTLDDIPTVVLMPAFVISELRTAFIMGFSVYIPFLIIDLVVSSILLSLGMMMLPPSLVSLPFKILLFIMVDGWFLIVGSLARSFM